MDSVLLAFAIPEFAKCQRKCNGFLEGRGFPVRGVVANDLDPVFGKRQSQFDVTPGNRRVHTPM
jgi:heat shock protein HspQ